MNQRWFDEEPTARTSAGLTVQAALGMGGQVTNAKIVWVDVLAPLERNVNATSVEELHPAKPHWPARGSCTVVSLAAAGPV